MAQKQVSFHPSDKTPSEKGMPHQSPSSRSHPVARRDSMTQTDHSTSDKTSLTLSNRCLGEESYEAKDAKPPSKASAHTVTFSQTVDIQNGDLNDYLRYLHAEKMIKIEETQESDSSASSIDIIVQYIMQKAIKCNNIQSRTLVPKITDKQQKKPQAPSTYKIRVMLETNSPPGTFKLLSGAQNGLLGNQGLLRLNTTSLTLMERRRVMSEYKFILDGEFLSANKASMIILKELQESFDGMQGTLVHSHYVNMKTRFHGGKITVDISATDKDSSDTRSATAHVIPAMVISGWPTSAKLQNPLPRPYIKQGQQILKAIQGSIDCGNALICLEVATQSDGTSQPSPSRPQTADPAVQHALAHDNSWRVNYGPVEDYLLDELFKLDFMADANLAYTVLDFMKTCNPSWNAMTRPVLHSIMLWAIKREGVQSSPADWFVILVDYALKVFRSGTCASYFQPNVNLLAHADKNSLDSIQSDFARILRKANKKPAVIIKMCSK